MAQVTWPSTKPSVSTGIQRMASMLSKISASR